MQQVADTDLADYFQRIDDLDQMNKAESSTLKGRMQAWPGSLFQAIDYLHETGKSTDYGKSHPDCSFWYLQRLDR
jgi:hypothetical protein